MESVMLLSRRLAEEIDRDLREIVNEVAKSMQLDRRNDRLKPLQYTG